MRLELSGFLPPRSALLRPEQFTELAHEKASLNDEDQSSGAEMWDPASAIGSPEQLETLASRLQRAVEPLSGKDAWKLEAIDAGRNGVPHREAWNQLLAMIAHLQRLAANSQASLVQHGPNLSDEISYEEQIELTKQIVSHLANGGNLGFFSLMTRRRWKKFVHTARVASGAPSTSEHFYSLEKLARLKTYRKELAGRWDRQMAPLGAPISTKLGEEIEKTLPQFAVVIQDCLQWHSAVWQSLEKEPKSILGFLWEKFLGEQPIVASAHGDPESDYTELSAARFPLS